MSSKLERAMQGVLNTQGHSTSAAAVAAEALLRNFVLNEVRWTNDAAGAAAATGTVAITELPIAAVKMPMRLVGAKFTPAAASTAHATHYWTLLVAARLAASPFTSRNLITYAADAAPGDSLVQWDEKDLAAYFSATVANLDVAEGELITVAVTKTGSDGLAFPAGTLELRFRPRDT